MRTFSFYPELLTPGETLATESKQDDIITAIEAIPSGGNVNLTQIAGTAVDANSGNKSAGSQRVVIATDDVNLSAINTGIGSFVVPSTLRPVAFDSYTSVAVTSVTGANQQIIAAPGANKQIWVYGWILVGTATGTVLFEDGDGTALTGAMSLVEASGSAPTIGGNFLMPRFKVPTNKSLRLDVVTATVNGQITYAIVSV